MTNRGLGVVDIVDGQEQLIIVLVRPATEFGARIGHDAQHRKLMFFVERQHLVEELSAIDLD